MVRVSHLIVPVTQCKLRDVHMEIKKSIRNGLVWLKDMIRCHAVYKEPGSYRCIALPLLLPPCYTLADANMRTLFACSLVQVVSFILFLACFCIRNTTHVDRPHNTGSLLTSPDLGSNHSKYSCLSVYNSADDSFPLL